MLKPLTQFVCDTCHKAIESPEQGYLEWLEDMAAKDKAHSFRIVHKNDRCQYPQGTPNMCDGPLTDFMGSNLAALYKFLDAGPYHDPNRKCVLAVRDVREFMGVLRRLTLPYYEEARLSWSKARADGYFDGQDEVTIYTPAWLKRLITQYSERDAVS